MGSNGYVPVGDPATPPFADGSQVPLLSNGEAIAVMAAWRRAAARSTVQWRGWYELTISALGWRNPGDRFVMTRANAKAPYPSELLELVWAWTSRLADDLDARGAVVRPLYFDTSWEAYERSARDAWEVMKLERAIPPKLPTSPILPPETRRGSFPWWAVLIVAGMVLAR